MTLPNSPTCNNRLSTNDVLHGLSIESGCIMERMYYDLALVVVEMLYGSNMLAGTGKAVGTRGIK